MKHILVPTDFSKASRTAAKYAVSFAAHFGAKVTLLNVQAPILLVDDSVLAFVMTTQAEVLENNKILMAKEVKMLSSIRNSNIEGLVMEGITSDTILTVANEIRAELIVMGMKGKGKSNSLFGSTTIEFIRKSAIPVFVIPEKAVFNPIEAIVLAADFSSETELNHYTRLMEISKKFNSKIYIVNVQKNNKGLSAEKAIGKMKTSQAFSNQKRQFVTIYGEKIVESIQRFVSAKNTDILAMVAHKHGLFERLFLKNHTAEMSYQTTVPLLVLQSK